jgi:phosphopantetheine adenylyltransferase
LIDLFLQKCDPNNINSLTPISKEIQDIANTQAQSDLTQNQTTYKGFIIEIETVPYTSTVNRKRALGKNQLGIILIQTELSFTTDEQTLINELKIIIDSQNLKAY